MSLREFELSVSNRYVLRAHNRITSREWSASLERYVRKLDTNAYLLFTRENLCHVITSLVACDSYICASVK